MITDDDKGLQRRCTECGRPIVYRRTTALYCSGKCRELHNARKRRKARLELKTAAPPFCTAVEPDA